ncbi:MAG: alpha/beta hydrolase [Candidatus Nomurabacteria bacterium]|nr:MAG: alpha/beta hydrolase [Candidatus Nomurabacteria bacterium]
MKEIIILHGTGSTPDSYWHPYLKSQLERAGHRVQIPQLPNSELPKLEEQLSYVLKNCQLSTETVLVGHSSGVPLILGILQEISSRIATSIMISGFFKSIGGVTQS